MYNKQYVREQSYWWKCSVWLKNFVLRLVNTFMLPLVIFFRDIPLWFPKETFDLGLVYNGATELLFLWCKDAWDQNILMTASAQSTGINLENLSMWKEKCTPPVSYFDGSCPLGPIRKIFFLILPCEISILFLIFCRVTFGIINSSWIVYF